MNRAWQWTVAVLVGSLAAASVSCGESSSGRGGGGTTTGEDTGGAGGAGGAKCDPAMCPAPSNECVETLCNAAGQCDERPIKDGTIAATQSAGDCQRAICQGGAVASEDDDSDLPDDGNECTEDLCAAGAPSHPALPLDSPCAAGAGFCDGGGTCAECNVPAQCPGRDTECASRTCEAGACGVSFAPQGQATMEQVMNDCLKNQCDGNGAIETVADDADVPDDGNACTDDLCNGGAPVHEPTAIQTPCGDGMKCDGDGMCVGCITVADCPPPGNGCIVATCTGGMCDTKNKPTGTACDDGNACTENDVCQLGNCLGGAPKICTAIDQCHNAGTCDPGSGTCSTPNKPSGAACNDGNACTQNDICQFGNCLGGAPKVCTPLNQCHNAGTCNANTGVCTNPNKPNGTACVTGGQNGVCQAGNCVVP